MSELGDLARQQDAAEQARLDERWDRLAAGTLTAQEEAELSALASSSPEAREAYEAFRPLGPEFQARVVEAAAAELAGSAPPAAPWEPRPRLLPFRRATRRLEVWLGTAAAAAAALFLLLRSPALPPLAAYEPPELKVASAFRGGEPGPVNPGSRLTLTVRPETAVDGHELEARGFLRRRSGEGGLRPWQPEPHTEITDMGVVNLQGMLGKDVQAGAWTIWIVVGRRGRIPSAGELQAELRAGRTRHTDWQAVSRDVEVRAPP